MPKNGALEHQSARPAGGRAGQEGDEATDAAALRRAHRQMAVYSRIAGRIVQENDLDAACRLFLEAVREHAGYGRAVLTLLDERGRDLRHFFTGLDDDAVDHFLGCKMTPADRLAVLQDRHRFGNSFRVPAAAVPHRAGMGEDTAEAGKHGAADDLLFIPLRGAGVSLVGTLMLHGRNEDAGATAESLSPLELFAGQMAHVIEKKRMDEAVQEMQTRLMAAQQQLMQAEKMSAIGQLISGVAHELNNPLSGIMGFAQLLLQAEVNPKVRKNLERIHAEAVRSQTIVQNLLSFARRHKPEKTSRSLNEVIDRVLELRAYQLQVDNVAVERRYDPELPETLLDFHQMQQVVLNVVNNAHQAMMDVADRPRTLVVTTRREGAVLRVAFTDSGTGIAPDRLPSIFDPFFTTKDVGKGTGLGLSLSQAIVRDHLGTMAAESAVGKGTTIRIDLPLLKPPAAAEAKTAAAEAPRVPNRKMKLLVVEDEKILIELLTEFLRGDGHDVDAASDGQAGLDLATRNEYDVILTDLKMPGLDGQGLYDRLCRLKPAMADRFVFATGDMANPKVQTFFQRNGCLYLSKPFKLEALLTVLEQVERRHRAA